MKSSTSQTRLNRRTLLKSGVATTAAASTPLLFTRHAFGAEFTNEPTGGIVKLGFTVSQSGAFADEGADELRAFQLAVEHLNGEGDGGMLNTMLPSSLQGNGILGQRVEYVVANTQTNFNTATAIAKTMIIDDGVTMISGGSSSGVAYALQAECENAGIVFMAGLAHANGLTGADKSRNGFRHHMNAQMSDTALSSVLVQDLGSDRSAYYLTADYSWGYDNESTIRAATEASGWNTVEAVKTPVGAGDFTEYLQPILSSGADTLILSHYGKDMVNSVTQAVELGLRDSQVNGNDFAIAIPFYSQLMAQAAGDNCEGVFGTINWDSSLQDAGSLAFVSSFTTKYGFPPSSAAHTCYVQTLLYADACERAGTFEPCQVIAALEGHEFDGLGNGNTLYRAADHQCFKDALVVRGRNSPSSKYDILEISSVVPRADIEYATTSPAFAGDLGDCNDGADTAQQPRKSGGGASGVVATAGLALLASARLSNAHTNDTNETSDN